MSTTPIGGGTEAKAGWLAEFRLESGQLVRFRHVRPDDEPLIAEGIRTASRETLLHRFFSPIRNVAPDQLRRMLTLDRATEVCAVGLVEENGATRIICGARYVRLGDPATAEIALTVHDDYQRRGLGVCLMNLLIGLAWRDRIRRLEAVVLASNLGMLRLLNKVDPGHQRDCDADVYHIVIDLAVRAGRGNPI